MGVAIIYLMEREFSNHTWSSKILHPFKLRPEFQNMSHCKEVKLPSSPERQGVGETREKRKHGQQSLETWEEWGEEEKMGKEKEREGGRK